MSVALLGLATTSSSIVGAALGLYVPLSKRILACVLAFAAGAYQRAGDRPRLEGAVELPIVGAAMPGRLGVCRRGFRCGGDDLLLASCSSSARAAPSATRRAFSNLRRDRTGEGRQGADPLLSDAFVAPSAARGNRRDPAHGPPASPWRRANSFPCRRPRGCPLCRGPRKGRGAGPAAAARLAELGEGEAFGEMALLTGAPRTAIVRRGRDASCWHREGGFRAPDRAFPFLAPQARRAQPRAGAITISAPPDPRANWATVAPTASGASDPARKPTGPWNAEAGNAPAWRSFSATFSTPSPVPGHRRQFLGFRRPVPYSDARDVPGGHSGGGG